MIRVGYQLNALVATCDQLEVVYKEDLKPGDVIVVRTGNSTYTMKSLPDGWFLVSGGWFDRKQLAPVRMRVNGCTWGGTAININVVAACGLCIEMSNRLVTTPVRSVVVFTSGVQN